MNWLLTRLYPKSWRDRYGVEFEALLEDTGCGGRVVGDVVLQACSARARHHWHGLAWLVAVVGLVATEVFAVGHGYTENIFWMPDSVASGGLLALVLACVAMVLAPIAVRVRAVALRRARR